MQIDLRMEPENWWQKTGMDEWRGQIFVMEEGKTARYITITRDMKTQNKKKKIR
jgi:hypothetical protein